MHGGEKLSNRRDRGFHFTVSVRSGGALWAGFFSSAEPYEDNTTPPSLFGGWHATGW
jgi:hypothetical protein